MGLTLLKITEEGRIVNTGISRFLDDELEECVFCGQYTGVRRNTPIDERKYYIEGVGQTHKECYEYLSGERKELPFLVTLYEPATLPVRKKGFGALLADLLEGF